MYIAVFVPLQPLWTTFIPIPAITYRCAHFSHLSSDRDCRRTGLTSSSLRTALKSLVVRSKMLPSSTSCAIILSCFKSSATSFRHLEGIPKKDNDVPEHGSVCPQNQMTYLLHCSWWTGLHCRVYFCFVPAATLQNKRRLLRRGNQSNWIRKI